MPIAIAPGIKATVGHPQTTIAKPKQAEAPHQQREKEPRDDGFLDINAPLMPQIIRKHWTREYYLDQVHRARYLPRPAVLFPWLPFEILTRTPWWVVPLVWLPVTISLWHQSPLPLAQNVLLTLTGIGTWSLAEYIFHRFLFHIDSALPDKQAAFVVHFLLHGFHHFLPMDRYRLVMPPVLFSALWIPPFALSLLALGRRVTWSLHAGLILGYIAYDLFHYAFHHANFKKNEGACTKKNDDDDASISTWIRDAVTVHMQRMKKIHLGHHYDRHDRSYGVTSAMWDVILGTAPAPPSITPK